MESPPTIREYLVDVAIRAHVDRPLLALRAAVSPKRRAYWVESGRLRDLLGRWLTPTSNCVDIGAYNGRVLSEIVRLAPQGHHIAYEPLPHKYRLLARRYPSVDVRQAAVSNRDGEATFTIVPNEPALSGLRDRWNDASVHRTEVVTVRVEALDGNLPPGYVPHFIKVDVEGAERLVFEGAIETIKRHRPTIFFEHGKGGADHYATSPDDVYRILTAEGGLRVFLPFDDRPLSADAFRDAYERSEQWDFIASV